MAFILHRNHTGKRLGLCKTPKTQNKPIGCPYPNLLLRLRQVLALPLARLHMAGPACLRSVSVAGS